MQEPSGQTAAPALQALLTGGALAGDWALDPRKSSIRLKSKAFGLPVTGVFREVTGTGTGSPGGQGRPAVTGAAAAHHPKKVRRGRAGSCARLTCATAAAIRTSPSPWTVSGPLARVSP